MQDIHLEFPRQVTFPTDNHIICQLVVLRECMEFPFVIFIAANFLAVLLVLLVLLPFLKGRLHLAAAFEFSFLGRGRAVRQSSIVMRSAILQAIVGYMSKDIAMAAFAFESTSIVYSTQLG